MLRCAIKTNYAIAVKSKDDFVQNAMFSNATLRLLMKIAGFERLGVEDVLGAAWIVPSSLKSEDLRNTLTEIKKSLETPFPSDGDDDPRKHLQKKDRGSGRGEALQGTLDVNFGSESEGEDVPEGPLFPANPRSKASALDELKKKRKKKTCLLYTSDAADEMD